MRQARTVHLTVTKSLARDAEAHLSRSCPIMASLVMRHGGCSLGTIETEPFPTLVNAIIGQHLSAKAARTIRGRFNKLAVPFNAQQVALIPHSSLRSIGISAAKAGYILGIASRIASEGLDLNDLCEKADNDVISSLCDLPGVGRWTAEMFLIFGLKRPDVLSLGDAGLQRAGRMLFGPSKKLEAISETWRPYRSIASWYLWRALDEE